jgi:sulfur relay protein TusC/DsrF
MEKVCLLFTHAPYGDVYSYEGLRVAIGLMSMGCDEDLGLFFFDEALLCLTKDHDAASINVSNLKSLLHTLMEMDVQIYACKPCMERYGIKEEDLEPSITVLFVEDVAETLDQYDTVLRF